MNQIKLFGKPIRVNMASSDKRQLDVGANLFVGGLDWNVDERQLWDAFSQLGTLVAAPQISRDPATGESKGYNRPFAPQDRSRFRGELDRVLRRLSPA